MNEVTSFGMGDLPVIDCCTPLAGATLEEERAADLEAILKALADRHRLRIINMLLAADGEPVCVCEIQPTPRSLPGDSQPPSEAAGRCRHVERETRGTYSYFSLVPGALEAVKEIFKAPAACC